MQIFPKMCFLFGKTPGHWTAYCFKVKSGIYIHIWNYQHYSTRGFIRVLLHELGHHIIFVLGLSRSLQVKWDRHSWKLLNWIK